MKNIFRKLSGKLTKAGCVVLLFVLMIGCGIQVAKTEPAVTTTVVPSISFITLLPAVTVDPKIALRESLIQVLGTNHGNLPRLTKISYSTPEAGDITITWALNDAVSQNLKKANAQIDATNILKTLQNTKTRFIYVVLIGTFSMQEKDGNAAVIQVMSLGFNKSKLDRIHWEDFQYSDIYDLADVVDMADEWK